MRFKTCFTSLMRGGSMAISTVSEVDTVSSFFPSAILFRWKYLLFQRNILSHLYFCSPICFGGNTHCFGGTYCLICISVRHLVSVTIPYVSEVHIVSSVSVFLFTILFRQQYLLFRRNKLSHLYLCPPFCFDSKKVRIVLSVFPSAILFEFRAISTVSEEHVVSSIFMSAILL